MTEGPKIVNTAEPNIKRSLKIRLLNAFREYLVMKLNEQIVLGLVHSGHEPVAGPTNIFFRKTGKRNWRYNINQIKISIINFVLMLLLGGI